MSQRMHSHYQEGGGGVDLLVEGGHEFELLERHAHFGGTGLAQLGQLIRLICLRELHQGKKSHHSSHIGLIERTLPVSRDIGQEHGGAKGCWWCRGLSDSCRVRGLKLMVREHTRQFTRLAIVPKPKP